MNHNEDDSVQRAVEIAKSLGETGEKQVKQIERAYTLRGEAFMQTLMKDVSQAQSNGEILTADGKPRAPGGIFFALLRQRLSEDEWFFINHGRARSAPSIALEWSERLEAVREAQAHPGVASFVRVSVVGRVDVNVIEAFDSYVLVTLYGGEHIPPLPKGLPEAASMVSTFRVGIPLSQWREVERDLRGGEPLIVSGYPMANEKKGTVTVYAIKATTPSLKQKKSKWKGSAR